MAIVNKICIEGVEKARGEDRGLFSCASGFSELVVADMQNSYGIHTRLFVAFYNLRIFLFVYCLNGTPGNTSPSLCLSKSELFASRVLPLNNSELSALA
jgi:hypothetical protein